MRSECKKWAMVLHCAPNNYSVPGHFLLGAFGFCKKLDLGMQEHQRTSFGTFSVHFDLMDQSRCYPTGAG